MTAPGALGDEVVLPWAVAGLPDWSPARVVDHGDLVDQLVETSVGLTSQVWGLPGAEAVLAARDLLARLRGPAAEADVAKIGGLNPPAPDQASRLLSIIQAIDEQLVSRGALPRRGTAWHLPTADLRAALGGGPVNAPVRVGLGVWEPLAAAVVLDHGLSFHGVAAAAGIGVGRRHVAGAGRPQPRAVVTARQALPNLSQQIWDAAGLVTDLGSPAAHVFETARSLGVPAVCGVDLGQETGQIVAVDGYSGVVAVLPLGAEPIP
jgi:phosphohistidine swiveling domain-containing protein